MSETTPTARGRFSGGAAGSRGAVGLGPRNRSRFRILFRGSGAIGALVPWLLG